MSALAEIQRRIDALIAGVEAENGAPLPPAAKRFAKAERMRVQVGPSAAQSILAVTGDGKLPESIDDVPVRTTKAFNGFEVVVL